DNIIDILLPIFDKRTPDILALLINTSLIGINRFLEINFFVLKKYNYIKNLQLLDYKSEKNLVEVFQMLNIMPNKNADKHYKYIRRLLRSIDTKKLVYEDFVKNLRSYFIGFFLEEMNLDISEEELIKSHIYSPTELISIFVGYQRYSTNGYMPILKGILKCYLQSSTHRLQDFLWDKNQPDYSGKLIASNNNKIHVEFEKLGINPNVAFKYPYECQFEVVAPEQVDINQRVVVVWTEINELSSKLKMLLSDESVKQFLFSNNSVAFLESIDRKITNYITQINKRCKKNEMVVVNNWAMIDFIVNQTNCQLLKKLMTDLEKLKPVLTGLIQKQPIPALELVSAFNQHTIDHIKDLDIALTSAKEIKVKDSIKRPRKFRMVVWDKSDPKTLLLGNYLSCCLATDSTQFPAIIERIIDCAMNMTVVIDEETNEPISGAWLYFATDVRTGKPYLVANFIEMRANIAQHQSLLRDIILSQLIKFTGEYASYVLGAASNKISTEQPEVDFRMAPLEYGNISDLVFFQRENHCMQKIGPMSLESRFDDYYLRSAGCVKQFYRYSAVDLQLRFANIEAY
ncbi:MAG: hypothetical protein KIT56_11505, partial [Gammaproteobacteria bacterium]|nr:hypothetical protein [Gammaproteobacteria bacterium]